MVAPRAPVSAQAETGQGKELELPNNLGRMPDAAFELARRVRAFPPRGLNMPTPRRCHGRRSVAAISVPRGTCDRSVLWAGIVCRQRILTGPACRAITENFHRSRDLPRIATPIARCGFRRQGNLRLLLTGRDARSPAPRALYQKRWRAGFLVQDRDSGHITAADLKVVDQAPAQRTGKSLTCLLAFHHRQHVEIQHHRLYQNGAGLWAIFGAGQIGAAVDAARIAAHKIRRERPRGLPENSEPLTKGSVAGIGRLLPSADGTR